MLATGFKKAISNGSKSEIVQKIPNAVLGGATSSTQKAVRGALNEAIRWWYHMPKNQCRNWKAGNERK